MDHKDILHSVSNLIPVSGAKGSKALAITFFLSGVWDTIAGILFIFFIGRSIVPELPMHPYYAIVLGSFFLCFAYVQFLSSFNIKRYLFNVGCLIFGRIVYVVVLLAFMTSESHFPGCLWFTGIIDSIFVVLYVVLALSSDDVRFRDLFVPMIQETI
jgi:hypothetical protein